MDESTTGGRRRSKGSEAASRATALQRLKALREGRRSEIGFQVKVEEPIYDTVGEDDYAALVAERRDAARDFIVDDAGGDGLGYLDEGEEEDWARAQLHSSSGSDSESERPRKKKNKPAAAGAGAERPKRPSASAASLSAAAATSQRLSKMFTSAVFTKRGEDRVKGSVVESIVDDVIAEFAPDEADRERRRRALAVPVRRSAAPPSMTPPIAFQVKSEMQNCVGDSAIAESGVEFASEKIDACENGGADGGRDGTPTKELKGSDVTDSIVASSNGLCNGEAAANGKLKVEVKKEKGERSFALNAKVGGEEKSVPSASAGLKEVWREERESCNGAGPDSIALDANGSLDDKSEFVLNFDGSLPFYLIDAHEEVASSGTLYLFGKVSFCRNLKLISFLLCRSSTSMVQFGKSFSFFTMEIFFDN